MKKKAKVPAVNPEIANCKKSGKKLYNSLAKQGVELTGYGVAFDDDGKLAIAIRLQNESDRALVPTEYDNYKVDVRVTGTITAL